ncbi:hypothetical protein I4U23_027945 [Adineta vaga]|nr:hypothetical protein I4U23_027945 [Adineta vaga]
MDDIFQDCEVNEVPSNILRHSNKKIRKRKQLDNLLKFRLTKTHPNDILRSSEDELFLPQQKLSITRHTSRHSLYWKYLQSILTISVICIFLSTCIGLIYANIQLKNNVQDLSIRMNEIERKYSKVELNNALSTIEQLRTRLNTLEHWNLSLIYNQLQKLQIHTLLNDKDMIPSKHRHLERKSLEKFDDINEVLSKSFDQLAHFVYNSTDKTTFILTKLQLNLDQIRKQMNECQCSTKNQSADDDIEHIVNQQ